MLGSKVAEWSAMAVFAEMEKMLGKIPALQLFFRGLAGSIAGATEALYYIVNLILSFL